jgi:hypothetical protein
MRMMKMKAVFPSLVSFVVFNLFAFAPVVQAQVEYRARPVTLQGEIHAQSQLEPAVMEAQVPVYRVVTEWVPRSSTCNKVECSNTSGDGSTGNWHEFFNVPQHEKPKALADAIKGIGIKTAELVVKAGFFKSKPRSWGAFTQEIERAQRELARQGYQGRFSELVLEQYGQQNAKNLGYFIENACRVVTYPCTVFEEVETERFSYHLNRKVEVQVSGQVLQSFEKDTFKIKVGVEPLAVEPSVDQIYNGYQVKVSHLNPSSSLIQIAGTGRKLVTFPTAAGSARLSVATNGLLLSGSIQSDYWPSAEDSQSRIVLEYKVCRVNWFGGCFQTQIDQTEVAVQGPEFQVLIPGNLLKKGSKHKVWYMIKRLGSKWYSAQGVEQTTDSVEYRK